MTKEPLSLRLYFQPHLSEMARFISYGGKRDGQVKEKCDEMRARFGDQKMMWAVHELTARDEKTGLTVLRPEVRRICFQLLGPAPEDPRYDDYWRTNRREPPPEHQPPPPEDESKPAPKRGRKR